MRQARFKAAPEASMYIITAFRGSWTGGLFWAIPKNWQTSVTGISSGTVNVELDYDVDGNTKKRTILPGQTGALETRYTWDGAGRMTGIQQGPVLSPTKETQITYDGLSRRVRLVEKTNGAVTSDKRYVWSGISILEERDVAVPTILRRFYEEGEQRVGGADAGSYYYFRDHLGSVREMVDASGTLRVRYNFTLYGERTKATGNLDTEMGYTGHWFHSPSGLHLAPYRTYDAELGRWLSRDPIGEMGGLNLYGYVVNDPVNAIDPDGKNPVIIAAIGIAIGAVIIAATVIKLSNAARDLADGIKAYGGDRPMKDPSKCDKKIEDMQAAAKRMRDSSIPALQKELTGAAIAPLTPSTGMQGVDNARDLIIDRVNNY